MKRWWPKIRVGMLLLPALFLTGATSVSDQSMIESVRAVYGERAALRTTAWRELMAQGKRENWSEQRKLTEVNRFFNRLTFIADTLLWRMNDYWASPLEFLGAGGGDCEDYSIAKYFSLLELGVPDERLRMVYVKALTYQQFHMVVAYYPTPSAVPLILDNINGAIQPATQRRDLVPIFSFNGSQLWLMKERGRGEMAGSSSRLMLWTQLQQRLSGKALKKPKLNLDR